MISLASQIVQVLVLLFVLALGVGVFAIIVMYVIDVTQPPTR